MALSRLSSAATHLQSATRTAASVKLLRRQLSTSDEISIDINVPFTAHRCDPPPPTITTTGKELLTFFRDMATMRRMEIAADSLYKAKLIRGFCHLYDGQEAVAVGMEAAITKYMMHLLKWVGALQFAHTLSVLNVNATYPNVHLVMKTSMARGLR